MADQADEAEAAKLRQVANGGIARDAGDVHVLDASERWVEGKEGQEAGVAVEQAGREGGTVSGEG